MSHQTTNKKNTDDQLVLPSFFWLHIKKAAGSSFRNSFTPPYIDTDRSNIFSQPFISLPKNQWNDTLNNYRIPLGKYDFKRMLFAKEFLYTKEEFDNLHKFCIVRNPYSRAVSCWKYLTLVNKSNFKKFATLRILKQKVSFQYFLEALPEYWETKEDRHIATHTAPIWNDITDNKGELLMDSIFRLENMEEDFKKIKQIVNCSSTSMSHINNTKNNTNYRKEYTTKTKKLVEKYFGEDLEKLSYSF
jgi:hypothetical protein